MKIQLKHCKRALTKGHPVSSLSQRGGIWFGDDIKVAKLVLRSALLSFISSETLAWDGERIHPLYEIESSLHIKIPQIKTHSTSKSKATSPIHQTESQTSHHIEIPQIKSSWIPQTESQSSVHFEIPQIESSVHIEIYIFGFFFSCFFFLLCNFLMFSI